MAADGDRAARLEALSGEAARLAEALAGMAEEEALRRLRRGGPARISAGLVRRLIEARRRRLDAFGLGAGHPSWNLMLELFAARLEGRELILSSLAAAAGLAPATASDHVDRLAAAGLAERRAARGRGRPVRIDLTDDAAGRMYDYFRSALTAPSRGQSI